MSETRSPSPWTASDVEGRARRDHLAGRQARRHRDPAPVLAGRPATAPTATAAPAWSRSRASACWPPPASARRPRAWWSRPPQRAKKARKMVMELLVADQPAREGSPRHRLRSSGTGPRCDEASAASRFPARTRRRRHLSHAAMAVNLDACIHCNLCVRACREVQVNDVIGMAGRGARKPRSSSTSTTPWATAPASPAANACRPARPAR